MTVATAFLGHVATKRDQGREVPNTTLTDSYIHEATDQTWSLPLDVRFSASAGSAALALTWRAQSCGLLLTPADAARYLKRYLHLFHDTVRWIALLSGNDPLYPIVRGMTNRSLLDVFDARNSTGLLPQWLGGTQRQAIEKHHRVPASFWSRGREVLPDTHVLKSQSSLDELIPCYAETISTFDACLLDGCFVVLDPESPVSTFLLDCLWSSLITALASAERTPLVIITNGAWMVPDMLRQNCLHLAFNPPYPTTTCLDGRGSRWQLMTPTIFEEVRPLSHEMELPADTHSLLQPTGYELRCVLERLVVGL